jgi:hypothetical protein
MKMLQDYKRPEGGKEREKKERNLSHPPVE